jgi:hypothetical protein
MTYIAYQSHTAISPLVIDVGTYTPGTVKDHVVGPLVTVQLAGGGGGSGTLTRKTTSDGSIVILDTATGEEFPI